MSVQEKIKTPVPVKKVEQPLVPLTNGKTAMTQETRQELEVFTNEVIKDLIKEDIEMKKLFILTQSNLFTDIKNFKEAITKFLVGRNFGLDAINSLKYVYIQERKDDDGKVKEKTVGVSTVAIAAILKNHKHYNYTTLKWDHNQCEIMLWRDGKKLHEDAVTYTIEDAKNKNLLGRKAWKQNPKQMLFYRALSKAVKMYAPDVVVYGANAEGIDFMEDGAVVDFESDLPEVQLTSEEIIARGEQSASEL